MPIFTEEPPALFGAEDLSTPLGRQVTEAQAKHAERIVWGWLKRPLGLTDRPAEPPDEIYAWAVELGAIYIENPSGMASYQLSAERIGFSAERRNEILAEAGAWTPAGTTAPDSDGPQGHFPPALPWPDTPAGLPPW